MNKADIAKRNMDKITYTNNDINFLLEWRDRNQDLVRMGVCPIKAIKIISIESGITLTCIRRGQLVNISITQLGRSFGVLTLECLPFGFCKIVKCTAKTLKQDDLQSVITVYASTMAIMAFGGQYQAPPKEKKNTNKTMPPSAQKKPGTKKSKSNSITYVLRRTERDAQIVRQGSHARPEGTFSVRGHFRHYKNGRVIWIAEYVKGSGKDKAKNYRL